MAKVRDNLILEGLSGSLGKHLMLRRLRDGRTILCVKPDFSNRKFSDGQLSHQQRFQEAAAYARKAAKDEPLYAELAAGTMKSAYNVALSDWFHPPVIRTVERTGNTIRIQASDDVRVTRVWVMVLNGEQTLEQGEAVPVPVGGDWWEVAVQAGGDRLIVKAQDLPGNVTETKMGE